MQGREEGAWGSGGTSRCLGKRGHVTLRPGEGSPACFFLMAVLPQGDFVKNVPMNHGVFTWPDGSTYEGEVVSVHEARIRHVQVQHPACVSHGHWCHGKRHGKVGEAATHVTTTSVTNRKHEPILRLTEDVVSDDISTSFRCPKIIRFYLYLFEKPVL